MKLIKNASVYKAELPSADNLRKHLEERKFAEIQPSEGETIGFVEVPHADDLVATFTGGMAFALRYDAKVMPSSAITAEVNKRALALENEQGFRPGRKQRRELRENVIFDFLPKALVKSTVVTCFYDTENKYLIIPTASAPMADRITSQLVHACGSIKTTTINISNLTFGLTTRLMAWLDNDDTAFGEFDPCDAVSLKRMKETIVVRREALAGSEHGIHEAITSGFHVNQIKFTRDGAYSFGLTSDFRFRGISFETVEDDTEFPDKIEEFKHEAAVQVLSLAGILNNLCAMFEYKPPVEEAKEAA